ncbi:DUF2652 domain-containing protein [Leptobacterium flavescens]|uniref:DUF2652 domain-containing protein n=1 Tax=Leptobacterium flavescens TaxID=472055 RepID=A0A6P0ULH9_9FLAO|nr:DUF2652 domain-containing protein [Leptobacterium flavescens]NER13270.1 DUF2652 domain-containing protein [Leptobacterium flavescens]
MTQTALFFIPDISGFTEFVHNTAISHSRHIISELLEILIDSNTMDFELAEIEGDALFFYKIQENTDAEALREQIKQMYIAFHTHLKRYEYERICQCGACSSAYNLSLKFVIHFGEIDFIKIKDRVKPHGSPVIQAHRLLKNQVPLNEYALITENVSNSFGNVTIAEEAKEARENYDFGSIGYMYFPISAYKEELPYVAPIPEDIPKHKIYDVTEIVNVPVLDLYEVISNFDYRLLWNKEIDYIEYEKNKVNRAGTKHQCLVSIETVTKKAGEGQLVYGENTKDIPLMKEMSIFYILEETEKGKTKLNIEVFADFKILGFLLKPFIVKKLQKRVATNLKELILLVYSEFKIAT